MNFRKILICFAVGLLVFDVSARRVGGRKHHRRSFSTRVRDSFFANVERTQMELQRQRQNLEQNKKIFELKYKVMVEKAKLDVTKTRYEIRRSQFDLDKIAEIENRIKLLKKMEELEMAAKRQQGGR